MKLSTKFIAALATSTFLVAVFVSADSDSKCNTSNVEEGIGIALGVLSQFSPQLAALEVFFSVASVVGNLGCAADILCAEDVEKIAECLDRENDVDRLQRGVGSLADLISNNKTPRPSAFENYATEAQALEADGASTGYQAALLNVDLAVIKLAMFTGKYLSLEDSDKVKNAKRQAVGGIETSLEFMKDLEDDLDSIFADGRDLETKRKECTKTEVVPCVDIDRPVGCTKLVCIQWKWDLEISYWCNSETYRYSTEGRSVSDRFKNDKIEETKRRIKNKFFPTEYYVVKEELEAQRISLRRSIGNLAPDLDFPVTNPPIPDGKWTEF